MPVFDYRVQTRFSDADGFGHVNNAVYFSYLENAREQLYRETRFTELLGRDRFVLVSHQRIEYRNVLEFREDPVGVGVWVARLGRSSFDLAYRVFDPEGETEYGLAMTGMVVVDRATGRPVPMSQEHRAVLEPWIDAPPVFRG
ncbi:acyl-CoA thioesterase [Protaetiibacter sp. SSC-01]|uniref:acyl-CoA thioesterase n=1 Tax=Protaetiibacter sp. SSC-01 TaxID=2759943 RepID=UPI001656E170|nr:thioesterase family protein [Protaetiibacter sp. SSC-01]QNO38320.1 acyl-CoA thioesterase [Protaetiibacter sp. SSC-01]